MHPFTYVAPRTLDEAIAVLDQHGERARPFAGGTDVLVQLRGERFDLDAIVVAQGARARLDALNPFLAEVRASGFVQDSIDRANIPGVEVAPTR